MKIHTERNVHVAFQISLVLKGMFAMGETGAPSLCTTPLRYCCAVSYTPSHMRN